MSKFNIEFQTLHKSHNCYRLESHRYLMTDRLSIVNILIQNCVSPISSTFFLYINVICVDHNLNKILIFGLNL